MTRLDRYEARLEVVESILEVETDPRIIGRYRAEARRIKDRIAHLSNPVLPDYDESGNFIGQVKNENGWTP